jgi:hypothetical protein
MKENLGCAYSKMLETLKKYSFNNRIPIRRTREALARIHRMPRPFNTKIINEMHNNKLIKLNGRSGDIELLK